MITSFLNADQLRELPKHTRASVLTDKGKSLDVSGVYAWLFDEIPPGVPTDNCLVVDGFVVLYLGISPKDATSKSTMKKRILTHYQSSESKNASISTLRLSLGCLLDSILGIELRQTKAQKRSKPRLTFTAEGEARLSQWMHQHAHVIAIPNLEPWSLEKLAIREVSLPLNLHHNSKHPFYSRLCKLRDVCKQRALAKEPIPYYRAAVEQ